MDTANAPIKVVFPPPPPTTNALTTQQRNQLLRKTKKLEQILGAAPHLIDASMSEPGASVRVTLPRSQTRRQASVSSSRGSTESFASSASSSGCSSTALPSPSSTTSGAPLLSSRGSLRRSSSTLRKPNPSSFAPLPPPDSPSYETWSETKPPFLRIATTEYSDQPAWSASCSFPTSKRYTLAPSPQSDSEDPFQPPSFNVSMGSTRKSKMDRLRRKLGHGIPIELVFPKGSKDEGDNDHEGSSSSDESPVTSPTRGHLAAFVYPSRSEKGKSVERTISGSCDSLIIHASRHSSSPSSKSSSSSRPRPPSIRISTSSAAVPTKGQLTAIIESPDEHGSGCSEEFGLSRSYSSGSESSFQSVGKDNLDESEIRLWSTRRGYGGWAAPAPSKPSLRSILRL